MENVAWPMKGRRAGQIWPGVARYWSSKGNADEQSDEHLLLRLAHPACLVREVQIQAFKAEFQAVSSCCKPLEHLLVRHLQCAAFNANSCRLPVACVSNNQAPCRLRPPTPCYMQIAASTWLRVLIQSSLLLRCSAEAACMLMSMVILTVLDMFMQAGDCCNFACREPQSMHRRRYHLSWVVWTASRPLVGQGQSQPFWRHRTIVVSSTGHPNTKWPRMLTCSTLRSHPHHAWAASCRCLPLQPPLTCSHPQSCTAV